MLQILGKSTSIPVRKVLWLCEELGLPYELRHGRLRQRAAFLAHGGNGVP